MSFPSWCRPAFASLFASTAFRLQKCCLRAVSCLGFQWCYPFPTSSFRIISFLRICCWEMPPPCCHLTDHLHPTDHRGVTHCGETDLLATCHLHRRDAGMDGPVETIHPDGERMFVPYEKETCAQPSLAHVHRITARGHVVSTHEPGLQTEAWTWTWAWCTVKCCTGRMKQWRKPGSLHSWAKTPSFLPPLSSNNALTLPFYFCTKRYRWQCRVDLE